MGSARGKTLAGYRRRLNILTINGVAIVANHPNNPAVEAVDLTRSLPLGNAQVPILNGVSLTVEHGEWVALTGPSGSGKSTLLGLMAGLDTPTSGRIVLDGIDITRLGESQLAAIRNQKVGVVFQSFNLIPSLTAQENVEVPLYVNPDRKRIRERAGEMLELVGLGGAARRPADGRGGGGRAQSLVAAMPKGLRISLVVLGGIVVLASSAFVAQIGRAHV